MNKITEILSELEDISPLLKGNFNANTTCKIDLSVNNPKLKRIDLFSVEELSDYIFSKLKDNNCDFGIGGYKEDRQVYAKSDLFGSGEDARTIHIGVDIWCKANTPIFCPLDAGIHSFKNNSNFKDYGPTIILEHHIKDVTFYTLYGHLTKESIAVLELNHSVLKGDQFARIGDSSENGNWPPHLHFQIITDIGDNFGDFPGVVSKKEQEKYEKICPDPKLILGF